MMISLLPQSIPKNSDYPVVIDHKKKTLETVLGKVPEGTVYLPFDIRKNSVEGALKQAGYRKEETTLFFWEDATAYSEPAAMDASLRFIADNAAAGSEIAFTYIPEKLVKGDYSKYRRAVFQAVRTASAGEPWRFGIPEGGAEAFLDRRGLRLVADIGAEEMVRQYLIQSDGTPAGKPTPYLRLLRAAVPE
jgi:methyltransferase (TIGR00027 family)